MERKLKKYYKQTKCTSVKCERNAEILNQGGLYPYFILLYIIYNQHLYDYISLATNAHLMYDNVVLDIVYRWRDR